MKKPQSTVPDAKVNSPAPLGEDWVTQLPARWAVSPLKFAARLNPEQLGENTDPDFTFRYIDISSVDSRGNISPEEEMRFSSSPSRARRRVRAGDTIVATVRTYLKAIAFIDSSSAEGIASTGFAVLRPRPGIEPRYLWRFTQSEQFVHNVVSNSVGVSYPAINPWKLGQLPVAIPPQPLQRRIADFLDRKTAKIDSLIETKQRLIELLEEKRSALITRAVTKGLDPNVSTKDSGVEWVGKIPVSWEMTRLGLIAESIQTGPFGTQLHADEYISNGIPVINPSNITDKNEIVASTIISVSRQIAERLSRHWLQSDDIVVARRGELGRCAVVSARQEGWICGTGSLRVRPRERQADSRFLVRIISCRGTRDWLELQSVGSTMSNLNSSIVGRIPCPRPPRAEQIQISDFLDEESKRLDKTILSTMKAIGLLHEYRTSLISSAVTGKIDVSGLMS